MIIKVLFDGKLYILLGVEKSFSNVKVLCFCLSDFNFYLRVIRFDSWEMRVVDKGLIFDMINDLYVLYVRCKC